MGDVKLRRRGLERVEALIRRLDRWLAAERPDSYARLQPGVTDAQLDAFEAQFALKLPAVFRALCSWRNGQTEGNNKPGSILEVDGASCVVKYLIAGDPARRRCVRSCCR